MIFYEKTIMCKFKKYFRIAHTRHVECAAKLER